MVRDLSDKNAPLRELQSRERRAQSATPLRNAEVNGGQTNFIGDESLKVEGSEIVVGLLWIQGPGGELRMAGTLNGNGTMNWTGPANFTGNVVVSGGGNISAGNLVIDAVGGGRISHPTVLLLAAPIVGVNALQALGDVSIQTGSDFIPHLPLKAGATPNVHSDSSGKLHRTS